MHSLPQRVLPLRRTFHISDAPGSLAFLGSSFVPRASLWIFAFHTAHLGFASHAVALLPRCRHVASHRSRTSRSLPLASFAPSYLPRRKHLGSLFTFACDIAWISRASISFFFCAHILRYRSLVCAPLVVALRTSAFLTPLWVFFFAPFANLLPPRSCLCALALLVQLRTCTRCAHLLTHSFCWFTSYLSWFSATLPRVHLHALSPLLPFIARTRLLAASLSRARSLRASAASFAVPLCLWFGFSRASLSLVLPAHWIAL